MISVVIPVLNNKVQLSRCLDSVIACDSSDIEIIVIDGGSSDGTQALIEDYSDVISYWESGLDSGISDAFNRGISKAHGDVIAILNSDDCWHVDTIKLVESAYAQSPKADVFYGDLAFFDSELDKHYIKKPNIDKMKYRMNVFHPAMFVSREAYNKVGLYHLDFKHAMDSEWCHRALALGLTFKYIPNVLTTMQLGGVSDVEYKKSLREYRQSIIQHGITTSWQAWLFYSYFLILKSFMRLPLLRTIKYRLLQGR